MKVAGIGKGMLFYYFNNKQELFDFLIDYSFECADEYFVKLENSQSDCDFIEKYRQASKYKMEVYIKYPHVFSFLTKLLYNKDDVPINEQIIKRCNEFEANGKKIFQKFNTNADMSKFRTDISIETQIKYIHWIMDGYSQELITAFKNHDISDVELEPIWKQFDDHLDNLKLLFYRQN